MPASKTQTTAAYPAGLGRRMGALLYDAMLVVAIWMVTLFAWVILFNDGNAVTGLLVQLVLVLELLGFYLIFWSRQGQTLGMAAWHIRLVDSSGQVPTLRALCIRAIASTLSIFSCGAGYLWIYADDARQTWHDRLSHTMVVHIP